MSEQEIRARWRSVGDAVAEGKEIPQVTLLLAYASDVRELLDMLTTERDAATARTTALEQRVRDLEAVLAPLAEFAQATIAIDAHYAGGHPHMTTEMAREWPGVCERAQAALAALAAAQEEAGAGEPAQEDRCEP